MAESIFYRARRAAAALFTRRCVCCGKAFSGRQCICGECAARLVPAEEFCGFDFAAHAAYSYEGAARDVMLRFKFGENPELCADTLADWLCSAFDAHYGGESFDFVVSVPSFGGRPRMELFIGDFAKRRGLRYRPELLIKTRPTEKQHHLSAAERRTNLRGAFAAGEAVRSKSILLADDIFTTGSTVQECCAALRAAGAESVSVLTVLKA